MLFRSYSPTRILVEDTRYSDGPELDESHDVREVEAFCRTRGWRIDRVVRHERGALPIPLSRGDLPSSDALRAITEDAPVPMGVRAGLFHPVTGYSQAWAVQAAWKLGELSELNRTSVIEVLSGLRCELARAERFHLFLKDRKSTRLNSSHT